MVLCPAPNPLPPQEPWPWGRSACLRRRWWSSGHRTQQLLPFGRVAPAAPGTGPRRMGQCSFSRDSPRALLRQREHRVPCSGSVLPGSPGAPQNTGPASGVSTAPSSSAQAWVWSPGTAEQPPCVWPGGWPLRQLQPEDRVQPEDGVLLGTPGFRAGPCDLDTNLPPGDLGTLRPPQAGTWGQGWGQARGLKEDPGR